MIEGYSKESMNIDEIASKHVSISRQLTTISNEKARNETESLGFTSEEHDNM